MRVRGTALNSLFEINLLWNTIVVIFISLTLVNLVAQVNVVSAKYVMKCDDDTFVRLDTVIAEIKKVPSGRSLYMGSINIQHKPLRHGKWAVTYEVKLM
jgi:hypothetical protein